MKLLISTDLDVATPTSSLSARLLSNKQPGAEVSRVLTNLVMATGMPWLDQQLAHVVTLPSRNFLAKLRLVF